MGAGESGRWARASPTQLVFRSIGYTGVPLPDVPFDSGRGLIRNGGGRVFNDGATLPGEYVTGCTKRGPSGVIGTNKKDSLGHGEQAARGRRLRAPQHALPQRLRGVRVRLTQSTPWSGAAGRRSTPSSAPRATTRAAHAS